MKPEELFIKEVKFNRDEIDDWDEYPYNIPVIRNMDSIRFTNPVTIIVAENGLGKSTLLEAIACRYGFNPEGGSKNFNFSTYASHSTLHEHLKMIRSHNTARDGYFFRTESYYNVASKIEDMDKEVVGRPVKDSYGGTSLHEMSHGESFFALLKNRLGGNGFYIMDEPESALSPQRLLATLVIIHELVSKNSQFIISTHSPIVMGYPGAELMQITEDGLRSAKYEELDHYRLTKYFLNNREIMLRELGIL